MEEPHRDAETAGVEGLVAAALFRILADGERHTVAELARSLTGHDDAMRAVTHGLATLGAFGMAIEVETDTVRVLRCIPFDHDAIERSLADRSPPARDAARWRVRVVFATTSTNSELMRAVRSEAGADRLLIVAEAQSAGRGRLGRRWASAPGASLTASFALRIERPLAALDGVTLACGLAVHSVLQAHDVPACLKWPNDLLVDGRKLAGILVEAHAIGNTTALVVGVGLNVASTASSGGVGASASMERIALEDCGWSPVDRNVVAARIALALDDHLAVFATKGFGAFTRRWNAADAFCDRLVTLGTDPGPSVNGIARGVDDRGALLLDVDGDRRRVIAGDLSLRPVTRASASSATA